MDNQEIFFTKLKVAMDSLEIFLHTSKKLALNLRKPFSHSSKPVFIDESELSKLKLKLEAIRAALQKADGLPMADAYDQLWMRELRDLECRAEDVVEEIEYESLRATRLEEFKLELLHSSTGKRKREASFLFSLPRGSLNVKIRSIIDRYREIAVHRDALRLGEEDGSRRVRPCQLTVSISFPQQCQLHGREEDMKKVTGMVLSDDSVHCLPYSVIPIVGMAGVGKTTLVQHLYHDEKIQSRFDLKIWVSMPPEIDVVKVTRKIVESIEKCPCNLSELDSLHHVVANHLKGKKFILVLDGVWDEDSKNWMSLQAPLTHAARGSKVIVTTRSMKVSQMMCPKSYRLSCLSDDICWLVCQQRACHGCDPNLDDNLTQIGKMIAMRCKGLPLAAEAVGATLSLSLDEKHWSNVLETYLWMADEFVNSILVCLRLSYDYLPLNLKRCFAYCSLFPKGYVFQKDKLVQLWIAQGFIHANGISSLENIGSKCFDDLVEKCFFQYSPSHYRSEGKYVMHELYHELSQYVSSSSSEYIRTEGCKVSKLDDKARHSSLVPQEGSHTREVIQLGSFGSRDLRTFLFVGSKENKPERGPFCLKISHGLFLGFECLRALDLSNTDINLLPSSIGNLIHLRYLSLENTRIKSLPESIGGLFNLQTMKMKQCYCLNELPKGTKLLDNLRHLDLPVSGNCCISMPSGIGQLTSLQTLPLFIVGSDNDGCGIEELRDLTNLTGELHISGLNNVSNAQLAQEANMESKEKLQKLTLEWSVIDSVSPNFNKDIQSELLKRLQPNPNLHELFIKGFPGKILPSWLADQKLLKLVTLDLKDFENCEELPSLGRLPSLKHLSIQSLVKLRHIGREFCGYDCGEKVNNQCNNGFPMLETLSFKRMDLWEEWNCVDDGDFPCLRYLTICRCSKLKGLPKIRSSVNLKVKECPLITISEYQGIYQVVTPFLVTNFQCVYTEDTDLALMEIQQTPNPILRMEEERESVKMSSSQMLVDSVLNTSMA